MAFTTSLLPTPVAAITAPADGTWRATPYASPWGETPSFDNAAYAFSTDGDYASVYCSGSLPVRFARSALNTNPPPATTGPVTIDAGIAATCSHLDVAGYGNTWVASWAVTASLFVVYVSTDDGATWAPKLSVAKNVGDQDLMLIDGSIGRWGIVMSTADSTEVRWYRTSNNWATLDQTDVGIANAANLQYGHVRGLVWNTANVELYMAQIGSTGAAIEVARVTSTDGGEFWTSLAAQCSIGVSGAGKLDANNWLNAATDGTTGYLYCAWSITGTAHAQVCRYTSFAGTCTLVNMNLFSGSVICNSSGQAQLTGRNAMAVISGTAYFYSCQGVLNADVPRLWLITGSGWTAATGTTLPTNLQSNVAQLDYYAAGRFLAVGLRNANIGGRVEIHAYRTVAPATADTLNVPHLSGFGITPSGSQVITREGIVSGGIGRNVVVYDGQTFAAGPTFDTGCYFIAGGGYSGLAGASIIDSVDGVNSGAQLASFYTCPANDEDVSGIIVKRVQGASFVEPEFPESCAGSCYSVIDDSDLAGNDDIRRDLSDLKEYPFDWSQQSSDGINHAYLSWAYGTTSGDVGIVTLTQNNGVADVSVSDQQTVDSTGSRNIHVCTTQDTNSPRDLLWAVARGTGGSVKGYQVNYDPTTNLGRPTLDVSLQFVFNPQVPNPASIACAGPLLLTVGNTEARLYELGQPGYRVVTACAGAVSYSALSFDGLMGVCQVGSNLNVFYSSNLTLVNQYAIPTYSPAAPCGVELTDVGPTQTLYFGACGASGKLFKWTVASALSSIVPCPECDTDGDGIPNGQDEDIDGDGTPNEDDSDIDGDGFCNAGLTGNLTAAEANPGRVGCVPGDTDSDGDGYPDTFDNTPGGTPTGPAQPAAPAAASHGLAGAGCGFSELLGFTDCDAGAWFIVAALALLFGQVGAAIMGKWGLALPGFLVGGCLAVVISWKGGAIDGGAMFVLMFLVLAAGLLKGLVFGGGKGSGS